MKDMLIRVILAIAVLGSPAAFAGSRSSANFTVAADVNDAGGRRTSSANYTNDGSIGSPSGVATVTAPGETNKSGYIGQLYELTNLVLTAVPSSIPGGSNTQVSASATLDDGSVLALAGNQVVWSIVSGPITSINANGVATAGSATTNTPATIGGNSMGQYATVAITVLAATGPLSTPVITTIHLSGTNLVFSGTNGTTGHNYAVYTSTNVALHLSNWTFLATGSFDGSGNFSFTNGIAPGSPRLFYVIQVQ